MPEKTKQKKRGQTNRKKNRAESGEFAEPGSWSEDQRKKSYYYDDAYGYEIYNPETDDNAENS